MLVYHVSDFHVHAAKDDVIRYGNELSIPRTLIRGGRGGERVEGMKG